MLCTLPAGVTDSARTTAYPGCDRPIRRVVGDYRGRCADVGGSQGDLQRPWIRQRMPSSSARQSGQIGIYVQDTAPGT